MSVPQRLVFPALLDRRRRVDQCLFAVVMDAYLHGTSTGTVDVLVKATGPDSGTCESEVSRVWVDRHAEVATFVANSCGPSDSEPMQT